MGSQLRISALAENIRALAFGLGFKLVLGPALVLLLVASFFDLHGEAARVIVFEAAMAPMIGAAIVAADHKLDPPLTALMVGIGIPLSFLTVPMWWLALRAL